MPSEHKSFTAYLFGNFITELPIPYVQALSGTTLLTLLLFVSVVDILKFVVLWYIGSASLCKAILMVEIPGLRGSKEDELHVTERIPLTSRVGMRKGDIEMDSTKRLK